jgi:phytoene desaturase
MNTKKKRIVVIGSGFSGLSAACYLAKEGYQVIVLEKNEHLGGRARKYSADGFTFDMGPSWYWMPDVFERFYAHFGKTTSDFYELKRLDPSYRVYWENGHWDIPASMKDIYKLFESIEKGSSEKLKLFLKEAKYKYEVGINKFVQLPGKSLLEYVDKEVFAAFFKMHLLKNMSSYVKQYFKDPRIISLLEFPVLFLGEMPKNTPALYSLMNYADMELGTWYPIGGMSKIIDAFVEIATSLGVEIKNNSEVISIQSNENKVHSVTTTNQIFECEAVVASADYHHVDSKIFNNSQRQYSDDYWESRKMAPSSLLYYLGLNKQIPELLHHNLFFDTDFNIHAQEIYQTPKWPSNPLFYVSLTSKTDPSCVPNGGENVFILIPTAPGLIDTDEIQEKYFQIVVKRIEKVTGVDISKHIVHRRNFATRDFIKDYHAHKGNAYGLANTLLQTGPLKPKMHHKTLKNLIFTGQLTAPGPGVPPSIISGELAARELIKSIKK